MFKLFFKDSIIYGLSNILSRGITFLLIPIFTRILLPKEYGAIDIIAILTNLANLIIAFEITQGVARYYSTATNANEQKIYASTAMWFSFFMYSLAFLLIIPFSSELEIKLLDLRTSGLVFKFALMSIWLNGAFYLLQNQLRWQLLSGMYAIASIGCSLATMTSSIIFVVLLSKGVIGVVGGQIVGFATGSLLAGYFCRKTYHFYFSWKKLKQMLSYSAPLVPSAIAVFVAIYIDRLAIKSLLDMQSVGLYAIGYRVAAIVSLLLFGFQSALTPLVFNNLDNSNTPNEIARIFRFFLALVLPLLVFIILFSKELLEFITTPAYFKAYSVIPLLGAATLLSNMYIFAPGLFIAKKTSHIAGINIFTATLNICLNFLLIPHLGINGAALATLSSSATSFILYMLFSQKLYPVPHQWKKIFSAIVVIMLLLAILIPNTFFNNLTENLFLKFVVFISLTIFLIHILTGWQYIQDYCLQLFKIKD